MLLSPIRRLSIEWSLGECDKVGVLVRKYETKAQTYENPNDKSEG